MTTACEHCSKGIHNVYPFGWLHDETGRRRCDLPVYVDAAPVDPADDPYAYGTGVRRTS